MVLAYILKYINSETVTLRYKSPTKTRACVGKQYICLPCNFWIHTFELTFINYHLSLNTLHYLSSIGRLPFFQYELISEILIPVSASWYPTNGTALPGYLPPILLLRHYFNSIISLKFWNS